MVILYHEVESIEFIVMYIFVIFFIFVSLRVRYLVTLNKRLCLIDPIINTCGGTRRNQKQYENEVDDAGTHFIMFEMQLIEIQVQGRRRTCTLLWIYRLNFLKHKSNILRKSCKIVLTI